jgi:hypothetical protein
MIVSVDVAPTASPSRRFGIYEDEVCRMYDEDESATDGTRGATINQGDQLCCCTANLPVPSLDNSVGDVGPTPEPS